MAEEVEEEATVFRDWARHQPKARIKRAITSSGQIYMYNVALTLVLHGK